VLQYFLIPENRRSLCKQAPRRPESHDVFESIDVEEESSKLKYFIPVNHQEAVWRRRIQQDSKMSKFLKS
jgi:hypothetical protein